MRDLQDVYLDILRHYGDPRPNRRGWVEIPCPNCGAEPMSGSKNKPNCSFNIRGWNCFSCGVHGGIVDLAKRLNLWESDGQPVQHRQIVKPRPVKREEEKPWWFAQRYELLYQYTSNRFTEEAWQRYKPVTRDSILQYSLGVGRLPGNYPNSRRDEWRLIVPLFRDDELIGFRGRLIPGNRHDEDELKWRNAKGTPMTGYLYGIQHAQPGQTIWVVENQVDAILISQAHDDWHGVALGTARNLYVAEVAQLQRLNPHLVHVALDNDLVGQAEGALRTQLEEEWRARLISRGVDPTGKRPPSGRGFDVLKTLLESGVEAMLFHWPDYAPPKADIGWLLEADPT